jgi:Sulfotransferase domain
VPDRPTVVLLGGFGRSGSTLLERVISRASPATALGEVIHCWERGLLGGERCGCGLAFGDCPFWTAVGTAAFGGWDAVDAKELLALRRELCTNRNIPLLLMPWLRPDFRRRLRRYVAVLDRLYAAAADVAGSPLLVDSSKHPSHAFLLRHSQVRLRVVLVVRDSRGVAYSWSKRVLRPEVADREDYMPTYSPLGAASRWSAYNLLFQLLTLALTRVRVVRYEDFVLRPAATIDRVLRFAGTSAEPDARAQLVGGSIDLRTDHTVAGNPMRFRVGPVSLRLDEEWRSAMPARARRLVSLASWPLRLRYGYVDGLHRGLAADRPAGPTD